jgi:hypothetical protein
MALDLTLSALLANGVVVSVFKEVLKNRSALFRDVVNSVGRKSNLPSHTAKTEVENAVLLLKDADLIRENTAPIEDFTSYYVTAKGLNAERQLKQYL